MFQFWLASSFHEKKISSFHIKKFRKIAMFQFWYIAISLKIEIEHSKNDSL